MRVAFVGPLASSFADRVRAHLTLPCDFVHTDEKNATDVLPDVDVLVTLVFTSEMGAAARRLRLIQVPGAGLDRIDRAAMPPGASLAKVHGHESGHRRVRARRHDRAQPGFRPGAHEPSRGPLG